MSILNNVDILSVIIGVIGTYFGIYLKNILTKKNEKEKEHRENKKAALISLYEIEYEFLVLNTKLDVLSEYKGNEFDDMYRQKLLNFLDNNYHKIIKNIYTNDLLYNKNYEITKNIKEFVKIATEIDIFFELFEKGIGDGEQSDYLQLTDKLDTIRKNIWENICGHIKELEKE